MSDVIDRPMLDQESSAKTRLRIIDCDIHPSLHARSDLNPFLSKRWQEHLKTYGDHLRTPYIGTTPYPRSSPLIARRDAWPPTGGPPGSDLDFMRKQHLDPLDVEFGMLQVLDMFIFSQQNLEFGAAIQRAVNEWQLAHWTSREPRLKAAILVGQDDTDAAVAEIERCAKIGQYLQINVSPRANEPLGRRRYWPIYALAEELGPAARHSCRRLRRPRADRRRLAVLLCRGAPVECAFDGGNAGESGDRRRARAFSTSQDRVHRRRVWLDFIDHVANGSAFRTVPQAKCRISSGVRRNMCASISGSRPSRSTSLTRPGTCDR